MQNQRLPILIFAQSGRFIAQSANQAGYRVWVADCFADQDTLEIAERWQRLDPINQLSETKILEAFSCLSQNENCLLICGSGIEYHYPILDKLPANITLVGNSATTINSVQTPELFFNLLKKLAIPYPQTQYKIPDETGWLVKSSSGLGGTHIHHLQSHTQINDNSYFQHYECGKSGSGLFIADGEKALLLSVNQQLLQPATSSPFRLGSIISPWILSHQHQSELNQIINNITQAISLCGLNSIDFIISEENQLFILEINPRITASAELLDNNKMLFQHHLNACNNLLADMPKKNGNLLTQLDYYYADSDCTIPYNIVWPETCHDLPVGGSTICRNEPVCTVVLRANTMAKLQQQHKKHKEEILFLLTNYSSSSKL